MLCDSLSGSLEIVGIWVCKAQMENLLHLAWFESLSSIYQLCELVG